MLRTSLSQSGSVFSDSLRLIPDGFAWQNYLDVFTSVPFALFLWNSAKVAVVVVAGQVITCTLAGYAFARLRFPGRELLFIAGAWHPDDPGSSHPGSTIHGDP
jgi:multiple sugar transport system permease protein